jgi:hypothetical protein
VTSYIIARTLGVIDDTKASTSDRESLHPVAAVQGSDAKPPTIIVQSASVTGSIPASPSFSTDTIGQRLDEVRETLQLEIDPSHHPQSTSSSSLYEGNPALAGVGVFSPAASTPPSPTIERKRFGSLSKSSTIMTPLNQLDHDNGNSEKVTTTDGEGGEDSMTESGVGRKGSWGSMSAGLESSYAFIKREVEPEDSGVLRRRQNAQR